MYGGGIGNNDILSHNLKPDLIGILQTEIGDVTYRCNELRHE
jgi:hypothetical protein